MLEELTPLEERCIYELIDNHPSINWRMLSLGEAIRIVYSTFPEYSRDITAGKIAVWLITL